MFSEYILIGLALICFPVFIYVFVEEFKLSVWAKMSAAEYAVAGIVAVSVYIFLASRF